MQTYAGRVAIMLAEQFYTVESIKTWWSLSVQEQELNENGHWECAASHLKQWQNSLLSLVFFFFFFQPAMSNDTPW